MIILVYDIESENYCFGNTTNHCIYDRWRTNLYELAITIDKPLWETIPWPEHSAFKHSTNPNYQLLLELPDDYILANLPIDYPELFI